MHNKENYMQKKATQGKSGFSGKAGFSGKTGSASQGASQGATQRQTRVMGGAPGDNGELAMTKDKEGTTQIVYKF